MDTLSLLSAIIGSVIAIAGLTITVLTMWSQAEKEAGDRYDQMVKLRVEHPEVMALSRQWTPGTFAKVYGDGQESDPKWVVYYSYVELCLGYCNTVLVLWNSRRMSKRSFENHHAPLLKLILTEHNPIIEDMLREGKYVSKYIKEFRERLKDEGWDWDKQHRALAT